MLKFVEKRINLPTLCKFTKSTFSGVFTNFDSFIAFSCKHGLVNTWIFQYYRICSCEKLHYEIVYLKDIFKLRRYPIDFVDLVIQMFCEKLHQRNSSNSWEKTVIDNSPTFGLFIFLNSE